MTARKGRLNWHRILKRRRSCILILSICAAAEDNVRDNEFDYEALSSPLWNDISHAGGCRLCQAEHIGGCSAPYFCRRQKASAGCGGRCGN